MTNKDIAKVCHAVNTAYCHGIGDVTAVSWEDAPESQRKSSVEGVAFHMNGNLSPKESHEAWKESKIANGWKYGEVKDEEKKTHPCIVSYEDLPQEQRVKDYLFSAAVTALALIQVQEEAAPKKTNLAEQVGEQSVQVKYVGKREIQGDTFIKGLIWSRGDVKMIPKSKASLMARHPDVYEICDTDEPVVECLPEEEQTETDEDKAENLEEETRFQIEQMTRKDAIVEFIHVQWGIDVDKKGKSLAELKEIAVMHMDNFGHIGND